MAGNIKQFDSMMPTITGRETTAELAQKVVSFTYELVQQLQYQLSNLDSTNFNSQGLNEIQLDTTREIRETVKKLAKAVEDMQKVLGTVQTDLQEVKKLAGENAAALTTANANIQKNTESLTKLLKMIAPDPEGGGTIGQPGQRIDINGIVYINGILQGG